MKKYVKASIEDITEQDIEDAAVLIVGEILDEGEHEWGNYDGIGGLGFERDGGDIYSKLGLPRTSHASYKELLVNNGYSDIYNAIDKKVSDIVKQLMNGIYFDIK